ncbi:uncharacterized protein LOC124943521 [Impatiens glandulifera]|uniref:uncharacterized protein LOC124943521 n=1 Tax=Impatiens glandulifera TaxID=253017 RepID=UPI001FB1648D|nr:uncharacterized protein LOC124943521 [Impatiens glandulifera]
MSSSSSNNRNPKVVTLRSSDGIEFIILERVALMMHMIKLVIQHPIILPPAVIPLKKIDGKNLAMVIEYCDWHSRPDPVEEHSDSSEPLILRNMKIKSLHLKISKIHKLKKLEFELFKNLDIKEMLALVYAADDLGVSGLSDSVALHLLEDQKFSI